MSCLYNAGFIDYISKSSIGPERELFRADRCLRLIMLKIILLLTALWLAVRFVSRVIRITANADRYERTGGRRPSTSVGSRQAEDAEFEVIESQIKQKE